MKKQFSLEEYLAKPFRKVITRKGEPVRIIWTDGKADYPVIALIDDDDEVSVKPLCYDVNGNEIDDSDFDLFFYTEKREGWANVYRSQEGNIFLGKRVYASKEKAEEFKDNSGYLDTIHIEWEE